MDAGDDPPLRPTPRALVKIVGPCKAGKTTLAAGLRRLGYAARPCAQEHSDVAEMWQRIAPADWLVYLDVSIDTVRARSDRTDWDEAMLAVQQRRLAHARQHCDLFICTDALTPEEVLAETVAFLHSRGVVPRAAQSADGI